MTEPHRGKWFFTGVLVLKAVIVFISLLLLIQSNSAAYAYLFVVWGVSWVIFGSQVTLTTFAYNTNTRDGNFKKNRRLQVAAAYVQAIISLIFTISYVVRMCILLYNCHDYEREARCTVEKLICTTSYPSGLALTILASIWAAADLALAVSTRVYWSLSA